MALRSDETNCAVSLWWLGLVKSFSPVYFHCHLAPPALKQRMFMAPGKELKGRKSFFLLLW